MYARFVNYVKIGEKFSMPFNEVPKQFTMQEIDAVLGMMTEEALYEKAELKKAKRKR